MEDIRTMLNRVASGELSVDQAVLELKKEPFSEAGFDELGFAIPTGGCARGSLR